MRIKTYQAPDLATALDRAGRELGPDALVLSTQERPGPLGLTVVELTVAAPRQRPATSGDMPPSPKPSPAAAARLNRVVSDPLEPVMRDEGAPAGDAADERKAQPASRPADPNARSSPDGPRAGATGPKRRPGKAPAGSAPWTLDLQQAVGRLIQSGVSADLALRFASIAGLRHREGEPSQAEPAWSRAAGSLIRLEPIPADARCIFVAGPPGVGKTTTLAKIAARLVVEHRRRVVMAQADLEGIGSHERASIYGRHIGFDVAPIRDADALAALLQEQTDRTTVLVDTPGLALSASERLERLQALRLAADPSSVVVMVPAVCTQRDARALLEGASPLRPTAAALARLDEAARPGEALSAVARTPLPLSFLTWGQDVPDGFANAEPAALARWLFPSNPGSAIPKEIAR